MKSLKNLTGDSLEQLIDYQVVDQNGDEIGTLHSLWSEPDTGAVEFLGVKTGWLFGHNHVVPAEKAELDDAENVVRPALHGDVHQGSALHVGRRRDFRGRGGKHLPILRPGSDRTDHRDRGQLPGGFYRRGHLHRHGGDGRRGRNGNRVYAGSRLVWKSDGWRRRGPLAADQEFTGQRRGFRRRDRQAQSG